MVSGIHKKNIAVFFFQLLFDCANGVIAQGAVYIGVGIIDVQYHNIIGFAFIQGGYRNTQYGNQHHGAKE